MKIFKPHPTTEIFLEALLKHFLIVKYIGCSGSFDSVLTSNEVYFWPFRRMGYEGHYTGAGGELQCNVYLQVRLCDQ